MSSWEPLTPLRDAYRYDPDVDNWTRLLDLPWAGYGWNTCAFDEHRLLMAGKADGQIHRDVWLIDTRDMSARKIGESVIQTTVAPLIRAKDDEWWLVGGEPDSKKTRTNKVTIIRDANTSARAYCEQ